MDTDPLRLIFMGSPDFAVPALKALIDSRHEVVCVYSQPPRPAGRGQKETLCPIHSFADRNRIPVRSPLSLRDDEVQRNFARLKLDAVVVVAYGLMLPQAILNAPKRGCFNIHASLLPRWRGAAPIQRAIEAGDEKTGVSIMAMDEGLDTGGIYLVRETLITSKTTTSDLHDILAVEGAEMIVEALERTSKKELKAVPQSVNGVTYAEKLTRDEGRVNWQRSSVKLNLQIRALNPRPGVWCELNGMRLKILAATPEWGVKGEPGTVVGLPLVVACGEGALRVQKAQRSGKGSMDIADLVRGIPIAIGTKLG